MLQKKGDILVFTEGGRKNGFGHLTRTYAIAQAYQKLYSKKCIRFLIQGDSSTVEYAKMLKINYQFIDWYGKDSALALQRASKVNAILIDSYQAPKTFCNQLARMNSSLVWIDDFSRLTYPTGHVVVPAPYRPQSLSKIQKNCRVSLGQKFVILRKSFQGKLKKLKINHAVRHVLILLGGSGTFSQVKQIMKSIPNSDQLSFIWVAPSKKYLKLPQNLKIYTSLSDREMLQLMKQIDVAVSAAGQTLYELARVGVPTLAIQIAKNQSQNLQYLKKWGAIISVGEIHKKTAMTLMTKTWKKIMSHDVRKKMSQKAMRVTDGQGALRIAQLLDKVA